MKTFNATEFITRVKNEGKTLIVWYGIQTNWDETARDTSRDSNWTERITGFFENRGEAWNAVEAKANEHKAEAGTYDEFSIMRAEVAPDGLDGIDWEELEEYPDSFDEEAFYDLLQEENCTDWDDEVTEVSYDYPSVAGALLVVWGWETHVGYARMMHEIRYGFQGEDESICCPIDYTYRPQVSVVARKEELEGLSKAELRSLIETRLLEEGDWRWTGQARGYIKSYLNDMADGIEEEQECALIEYSANACDSDVVAKAFDKVNGAALQEELGDFQRECDALEVDAEGPTKEQDEQFYAIVKKYIKVINDLSV